MRAYIIIYARLYMHACTHTSYNISLVTILKHLLGISNLRRKCKNNFIFIAKYLVNSQKSSTFAPDFALNASERLTAAKTLKNRNAENQLLTKKV